MRKCVAMNRSLTNVLFGGISAPVSSEAHKIEGTITKTTVDDTADALANAENVILVRPVTQTKVICSYIGRDRLLDTGWQLQKPSMRYLRSRQCYGRKVSMFG